jgi:DNA polymerase-4
VSERTILHIDMNSFYASVELLDHPHLRDKPVAVGGDESKRRGIVLAKNEIAKQFGIRTAETLWSAKRKCPDLVVLPTHFEKYRYYSARAKQLYLTYTDRVESFGLDECWLDISGSQTDWRSGTATAEEIRRRVQAELGLTVSIGVSWNKVFAKLGSDYRKPNAVTTITPENFRKLLWPLPIERLLYVGRSTAERLRSVGVSTIGELARTDVAYLKQLLGKHGAQLWYYANGLDEAPVLSISDQEPVKSIGNSTTLAADVVKLSEVQEVFVNLAVTVERRLKEAGVLGRTLQITVRDTDFQTSSRQKQLSRPSDDFKVILHEAMDLFERNYDLTRPIRLLGITMGNLIEADQPRQMTLTDWLNEQPPEPDEHAVQPEQIQSDLNRAAWDQTIRMLQEKLGADTIRRASSLGGTVSPKYAKREEPPIDPA